MAAGTTVGFAVGSDFNAEKFWGNFIVEPYSHCPGPAYTICYWDTNGALFYLGSNTTALCTAVSADGNTAVGRVEWCNQDGFAWDAFAAGGVLRFLPRGPDPISTAEGVNRDGTRIVGQRQTDSAPYTFLPTVWTQTSFYYLPLPPGSDTSGRATGCSADGNVIFGLVSYYDEFQILREHTVAWINGVLNTIETDDIPRWVPMAASGDGATIVGYLEYTGFGDRGIIWDKERGPRFLDELLVNAYGFDFGAPPGPGIGMPRPTGISDDGSIIVGWGPNQDPAGQYCMVQLLDRQELRARIDHTNIIISWMPALGGMNLESRTADSTVWETLLTLDGTRGSYTNSISGPSKFFRLTAR